MPALHQGLLEVLPTERGERNGHEDPDDCSNGIAERMRRKETSGEPAEGIDECAVKEIEPIGENTQTAQGSPRKDSIEPMIEQGRDQQERVEERRDPLR